MAFTAAFRPPRLWGMRNWSRDILIKRDIPGLNTRKQASLIYYDDPASIAAKVRLARQKGLAGVGAWSLPHDSGGDLLDSAYRALQN